METEIKKETPKNIFDVLHENNICFAVCAYENRLKGGDLDMYSKDYYIIINRCDVEFVDYKFKKIKKYENVFEWELSNRDVIIFLKNIEKFVKVRHNKYGRVYELKGNSFKESFDIQKERYVENEIISGFWW
ncbi:MAG: hypothetical protein FWD60_03480 [Candidatus Azobacteroides sp.]|nr:hypothetical protein [Candidatus Azobacteroides sp.]